MDISTIVDIFDKYGWPGIICVCIIILGFVISKLIKNQNKNFNKDFEKMTVTLTDNMSKQNDSLVTAINNQNKELIGSLQNHNDRMFDYIINGKQREHESSIDVRQEVFDSIDNILRDLAIESHASRVCVIEFHNSKENLNGLSFLWYDIHYERPAKSVKPIQSEVRNQQASPLLPIVHDVNLMRSTHTVIYHDKELKELEDRSPVLYYNLINNLHLHDIIYTGIYDDKTNKLIGLLCGEFNYDVDDNVVNSYEESFAKGGQHLSMLLTFNKKLGN